MLNRHMELMLTVLDSAGREHFHHGRNSPGQQCLHADFRPMWELGVGKKGFYQHVVEFVKL